jgi:hypothetical protein
VVGNGIGGGPFITYVTSIATRGSDVYVGGVFPQAGTVVVNNIGHWNAQTATWSALGEGINNAVFAIAVSNQGEVIVGGSFTIAGDIETRNIASWNGSEWSALGAGLTGDVNTLGFYDSELFAGGAFTGSGSASVNHVGRWNGVEWITMGGGVEKDTVVGRALALVTYEDGVYVGGDFTIAGGHPSYYFAHWRRIPFLSVPQRLMLPAAAMNLHSYPNPATSAATISFTLPNAAYVTLTLTTLHGGEIGTLVNDHLSAGEHTFRWDVAGVPDGTYFYQLRSNGSVESGKVVIVR